MTNRLFISLDIPEYVREEINSMRMEIYGSGADHIKWEGIEKLHLTLKFLGDVEESKTDKILAAIQQAVADKGKLSLELDKFGIFERRGTPSILWLGLKQTNELEKLVTDINNKLTRLNFKKETRRFLPHITIMRLKGKENMNQVNNFLEFKLEGGDFTAGTVSLMKSELRPSGSIYSAIKSFYMI